MLIWEISVHFWIPCFLNGGSILFIVSIHCFDALIKCNSEQIFPGIGQNPDLSWKNLSIDLKQASNVQATGIPWQYLTNTSLEQNRYAHGRCRSIFFLRRSCCISYYILCDIICIYITLYYIILLVPILRQRCPSWRPHTTGLVDIGAAHQLSNGCFESGKVQKYTKNHRKKQTHME